MSCLPFIFGMSAHIPRMLARNFAMSARQLRHVGASVLARWRVVFSIWYLINFFKPLKFEPARPDAQNARNSVQQWNSDDGPRGRAVPRRESQQCGIAYPRPDYHDAPCRRAVLRMDSQEAPCGSANPRPDSENVSCGSGDRRRIPKALHAGAWWAGRILILTCRPARICHVGASVLSCQHAIFASLACRHAVFFSCRRLSFCILAHYILSCRRVNFGTSARHFWHVDARLLVCRRTFLGAFLACRRMSFGMSADQAVLA